MAVAADEVTGLFRTYHADLLRYAARRVGPADAPDVVGEVFVVVCRRHVEMPPTYQRAWLFAIAGRVILNHRRSGHRRERLAARIGNEVRTTPPGFEPVHAALARLGDADQELLRLIEWDGLPADEAAVVLDCSRAALRVRLHRARRRFAVEYERELTATKEHRDD